MPSCASSSPRAQQGFEHGAGAGETGRRCEFQLDLRVVGDANAGGIVELVEQAEIEPEAPGPVVELQLAIRPGARPVDPDAVIEGAVGSVETGAQRQPIGGAIGHRREQRQPHQGAGLDVVAPDPVVLVLERPAEIAGGGEPNREIRGNLVRRVEAPTWKPSQRVAAVLVPQQG
jgi:hypothetical protein